jgi:hypothetical protein
MTHQLSNSVRPAVPLPDPLRRTRRTQTYTARVNGRIWNGSRAYTDYTFDHQPTRAEIESIGDFSQVGRIVLTRTSVTIEHAKLAV